jgi:hypothetical protein
LASGGISDQWRHTLFSGGIHNYLFSPRASVIRGKRVGEGQQHQYADYE